MSVVVHAHVRSELPVVFPSISIVDLAVTLFVIGRRHRQDEGKKRDEGGEKTHGDECDKLLDANESSALVMERNIREKKPAERRSL